MHYGCLDEFNSTLGVARSQLTGPMKKEIDPILSHIQNQLFNLGSHLACENEKNRKHLTPLRSQEVQLLEQEIDKLTQLPPLKRVYSSRGASRSCTPPRSSNTLPKNRKTKYPDQRRDNPKIYHPLFKSTQ